MRRRHLLLVPAIATALIVSGCAAPAGNNSSSGNPEYVDGGTFTMAMTSELGGFDPYSNRGLLGLASLAYDSLVNITADGKIVSGLASEWDVSADGATFTLRDDVTCSDGSALTATQVADALTYLGDPANSSPQYGVNVPTIPFTVAGDDAAGTVTVTMSSPYGLLLESLGRAPIVCKAGMDDRESLTATSNGTGPYVLSNVAGTTFTLTVRDDYTWGPDGATTEEPGTPKTIVLKVVPKEATAANMLLAGEINFAKITGTDKSRLDAKKLTHSDYEGGGTWLTFNQIGTRFTTDPAVREALLSALDYDEIVKVSTAGSGTRATGLVSMKPQVCPATSIEDLLPPFDVDAANELLDDAGYKEGSDGIRTKDGDPLTIAIHYLDMTSPLERPTAELIGKRWGDIGVKVELVSMDLNGYVDSMYTTSDWDVLMSGWDFALPSQVIPYLSGALPADGGNNIAGVTSAGYEENTAKAIQLTAPDSCEFWDAAQAAIVEDAYLAPISNRFNTWYTAKAEAEIGRYEAPVPTSIRLLQ